MRTIRLVLAISLLGAAHMVSADEPLTSGGPATFRRLNEAQYKRSIDDIFGQGIKVPGRFEPPLRDEGLLAVGNSKVVVTPSGFEQYELRAREIAAQVLAEDKRARVLDCAPKNPNTFDEACARQFLGKYGRLLFRRPLHEDELGSLLTAARMATDKTSNFYTGLSFGLARLLLSPNFLFRVETTEPDPDRPDVRRLDAYALATRVSFLLWDAPPDTVLLDVAASGTLHQKLVLERQVDRLLASPRFEQGVRAFFSDMFAYEQFDGLAKDQSLYPKFTSQLASDVQEQSLRTIVDLLIANKGDYRDLFTTRKTFLNRNLGSLYKVQVNEAAFGGWMPYTFGPKENRAGILTLAGFLMLDPTHEGRSSPTIRGKSVRELLLCHKIPPPPPNVDFKIVQDTHDPLYKTARQRLSAHRDNPTCAGCHSLTDPIGLAMENYDAIGDYRRHENGELIDATGTFEDKSFAELISLQKVLHDSPAVPSCAALRVYEYGVGRMPTGGEHPFVDYLVQRFADSKYSFPALLRDVATSKAFQAISAEGLASNVARSGSDN